MSEPVDNYRDREYPPGPYPPAPADPPDMGYGRQPHSAPPAQQWGDQSNWAPPAQSYSAPPAQSYSAPPAQSYSAPPAQQWGQQPYSAPPVPAQLPAVYQSGAVAPQPYGAPAGPAVANYTLVTPGARLGAAFLDLLLIAVTFGIGWWIWSFFTWSRGQSPAKSLLGFVVADPQTGEAFDWGRMCVRELLVRVGLFGVIGFFTAGVLALVDCFMVFGVGHRTLHDRVAGSIVRQA